MASTHALVFRTEQLPLFFTWYDHLHLCDHLLTTHTHIHNWWALYLFIFDRLSCICARYNLSTVMRTVAVILIYLFLHTLSLLEISVHLGLLNFLRIWKALNMSVLTLMRLKPTIQCSWFTERITIFNEIMQWNIQDNQWSRIPKLIIWRIRFFLVN